jgi:hypothetical protein
MSLHVKSKVLKNWDLNEIALLHTKGDTKIAQGLLEDRVKFMSMTKSELSIDPGAN